MMVPSTPTYSDRFKEGKDLADDNARLRRENGVLARQNAELISSKTDIEDQIRELSGHYARLEIELPARIEEISRNATKVSARKREEAETRIRDLTDSQTRVSGEVYRLENKERSLSESIGKMELIYTELERKSSELAKKIEDDTRRNSESNQRALSEISNTNKKKEVTETDLDRRQARMEEEERSMTVRRTDLQIYELRLRKKYPNETIIL